MTRGSLFILTSIFITITLQLNAQEVLPAFKVVKRNGWAIISWNNNNKDLTQLIIQRSADSLKGFRSIISMPDPTSSTNGFVDKKPGSADAYYRIFYVMPGSRYVFTSTQKPVTEEVQLNLQTTLKPLNTASLLSDEHNIKLGQNSLKDSALSWKKQTDTSFNLLLKAYQNIMLSRDNWKPEMDIPKPDNLKVEERFNPSILVFTNADGNLIIAQPLDTKIKFTMRVYQDDDQLLFEMKNIREKELLIDRSNFHKSGWFRYELVQGDKIVEKNKFYIKPDVK